MGCTLVGMQSVATQLPMDTRRQAKFLYWMGWRVTEIAQAIGENTKTVHSWKSRDEWDRADNVERIGGALEARLVVLIMKPEKNPVATSKKLICCIGSWSARRASSATKAAATKPT